MDVRTLVDRYEKLLALDVHQQYLDYTGQLTAQQEQFAATTGNGYCLIRPELTTETSGRNFWYQVQYDGKGYQYMVTAKPVTLEQPDPEWISLDRKGYIEYNAWDLERQTPGPLGRDSKIVYEDVLGTITGYVLYPGDEHQSIKYLWRGADGASYMITRESVEKYFSDRGIKSLEDLSWYALGVIRENVIADTMEGIRSNDFEVTPDQVNSHVREVNQRKTEKTIGETTLDKLFDILNKGEKQCLGDQPRPGTVEPTVYYMNGKNGTEGDYQINRHLPAFMVFHRNEAGYMKVLFNKDDTVDVYLYPRGEQRPANTSHLVIEEGTTALLGGLLKQQGDDKNLFDLPIAKIDFQVNAIKPLDANSADNILPFTARS